MGTYAITGSASGMGFATAELLRAAGHSVIGVDLRDAEVIADLSTAEGRVEAASAVLELAGGRLDGAVLAAGIGPTAGPEKPHLITQINYFGVVDLLTVWRPALAAASGAKVVVFGSNSSSTVPLVPGGGIRALLANKPDAAVRAFKRLGRTAAPAMAYAGSKIAVSRWVRRNAVSSQWAGTGIRLNAIAPGAILTPLLQRQLDTPEERAQIEAFPVPIGGFGDAGQIAQWVEFMLSPAADFLVGSIVFVDGGTDAYFRADDWPRAVPLTGLPRYLSLTKAWKNRSR